MASKKEKFIEVIDEFMRKNDFETFIAEYDGRDEVVEFWENFKSNKSNGGMTENGEKILKAMIAEKASCENLFTAKSISEFTSMSSKTVSGSMRKLVTDGYVKKLGANPVQYSLTESGEAFS